MEVWLGRENTHLISHQVGGGIVVGSHHRKARQTVLREWGGLGSGRAKQQPRHCIPQRRMSPSFGQQLWQQSLVRGGTLLLWLNYQWSDRIWVSDLNSLFIYLSVLKMREVLLRIQPCPCSAQPGLNYTHPNHSLHHNNKSMEFLFFNVASSHSWRWGLCAGCVLI